MGIKNRGIQIQLRDLQLFVELFESRILTVKQAGLLFFEGSIHAAHKRIVKLKSAGFIVELPRSVIEQSVLQLAEAGFHLLQELNLKPTCPQMTWEAFTSKQQVSKALRKHELAILDVKSAFTHTIRCSETLTLAEFYLWKPRSRAICVRPSLSHGMQILEPDAFMRIMGKSPTSSKSHAFFLECDFSTEPHRIVISKILRYQHYYESGEFAIHQGATRADFRSYPFRVLVICKSARRRNNLAHSLLRHAPRLPSQVWLATLADVIVNPIAPVWIRPFDVRPDVWLTPKRYKIC